MLSKSYLKIQIFGLIRDFANEQRSQDDQPALFLRGAVYGLRRALKIIDGAREYDLYPDTPAAVVYRANKKATRFLKNGDKALALKTLQTAYKRPKSSGV